MKKLFILFIFLLFALPANAAVYLDAQPGQDCSSGTYRETERNCGGSGTGNSSYDTIAEFNTNMTAQAINYIRAGSYYRDTSSWSTGSLSISGKAGTSGSHTIITTIAGEERQAIIYTGSGLDQYPPDTDPGQNCPSNGTSSGDSTCYYPHPAIGISSNYVDIIALKTYGQILVFGDYVTIEDCDIGGGGPYYNWGHAIYTNASHDITIKNNWIHDNPKSGEANTHKAAVQSYQSYDITYEYNTFSNIAEFGLTCGDARYVGNQGSITARYNFFDSPQIGWMGIAQYGEVNYFYLHNNIFYNCSGYGIQTKQAPNIAQHFYNNTFINCGYDFADTDANFAFLGHNNLFYHSSGSPRYYSCAFTTPATMDIDYNVYYSSVVTPSFRASGISTTSLTTWKGSTGIDEDNSLSHNPNFENASGSNVEDFKRSSYTENFGGSSYGTYAGAYETGNEQIGYDWSGGASTNMRIQGTISGDIQ